VLFARPQHQRELTLFTRLTGYIANGINVGDDDIIVVFAFVHYITIITISFAFEKHNIIVTVTTNFCEPLEMFDYLLVVKQGPDRALINYQGQEVNRA